MALQIRVMMTHLEEGPSSQSNRQGMVQLGLEILQQETQLTWLQLQHLHLLGEKKEEDWRVKSVSGRNTYKLSAEAEGH